MLQNEKPRRVDAPLFFNHDKRDLASNAQKLRHDNQHATRTHHTMSSSVGPSGVETRAGKTQREFDALADEAIRCHPLDIVVSYILRSMPDPADLARLRAVSRPMRDAVAATGRQICKLKTKWDLL